MGIRSSIFDPPGLKEAESAYRFVLRREPDNMEARINLAWCLLLQALYLSGQESARAEQHDSRGETHSVSTGSSAADPDARHLLQECLRHSLTVKHLSAHPSNRLDVAKLEELVLLAGGKELLLSTEEGGARIIDNLVTALWQASEQEKQEQLKGC